VAKASGGSYKTALFDLEIATDEEISGRRTEWQPMQPSLAEFGHMRKASKPKADDSSERFLIAESRPKQAEEKRAGTTTESVLLL